MPIIVKAATGPAPASFDVSDAPETPAATPKAPEPVKAEPAKAPEGVKAPEAAPAAALQPVEAPAAKEEPKERESAKHVAELRRQRAAQAERDRLKQEREALKADKEAAERYQQAIKEAKSNPLKILEASGLTYDDLTAAMLSGDGAPSTDLQVRALNEKLAAFEQAQAKAEQDRLEREQQATAAQEEAVVTQWKETVSQTVSDPAKYPMIAGFNGAPSVIKTIEEHYQSTGKVLSIEEGAKLVEDALLKNIPVEAKRLLAIPAVREILAAELANATPKKEDAKKSEAKAEPVKRAGVTARPVVRTISNGMTASQAGAAGKNRSAEQVWADLIARKRAANG